MKIASLGKKPRTAKTASIRQTAAPASRRMGADWGGVFLRLRELEERVDLEAVRFPPVDFVAMFLSFLSGGQVVGRKWKSRAMPSRDSAPAAQQ